MVEAQPRRPWLADHKTAYTRTSSYELMSGRGFDSPLLHLKQRKGMPYKDVEKQRAAQRQWRATRRAKHLLGKRCVTCGSTTDLELDHLDRNLKVSHRIWSWSEARLKVELAKCQVLCRLCHERKTFMERGYAEHSARQYEVNGCRCDICREAHRVKTSAWRARRKSASLALRT